MDPAQANNAVYILASGKHGTPHVGVTSDLIKRIHEHREDLRPGFTSRWTTCTQTSS